MHRDTRRPLRIAHVLRKYDPEGWGGTETHVIEVARRLAARGIEQEIHAPAGPSEPDPQTAPRVPVRRYRAFCPFLGSAERRRALFANAGNIVSFDEPVRLARDRALALVHVHTMGRIGGAVRTAMRLTGRPYVVSVHGPLLAEPVLVRDDTARRLEGLWDLGRPLGALLGSRRVLDDADRVICFNGDEHRALRARIGDRAVRMHHGVDAERLGSGGRAAALTRWPELGSGRVIALIGRVSAQKNQLLAVRAFAGGAREGDRLALAGAATDLGYEDAVRAEARRLGVADRVHLLGNVPRAHVPDLLSRADLVLVPSLHEAFGLAVLEAWAAGRPTLSARLSGLADLGEALGIPEATVEGHEVGRWADALSRMLEAPALRERVAAEGRRLVLARFTWEAAVDELEALYGAVLEERGRRRAHGAA
jgi:D-inositol-3-phosphate glycosyltransferase